MVHRALLKKDRENERETVILQTDRENERETVIIQTSTSCCTEADTDRQTDS